MSIELVGTPTLNLKYKDPDFSDPDDVCADNISIVSALWRGKATVKVKDENNKKWRIGFVQILEKNVIQAIYRKTIVSETLKPGKRMPVLDAHALDNYRPFYDALREAGRAFQHVWDVQTTVAHPEKDVQVRMYDSPSSSYDWWHDDDEDDPLEEFIMSLQFATYIAARDITNGFGRHDAYIMKILKGWEVVLDRRATVKVVRDTSQPGLKPDLPNCSFTVANPMRQPFVAEMHNPRFPLLMHEVFCGPIANEVYSDVDTPRGEVAFGELVKARAALFGGLKKIN